MEQLTSARDVTSVPLYVIKPSDTKSNRRLAAGVEVTLAVPADATRALIAGDDYWVVNYDATAVLPTGSWTDGGDEAFDAVDVTDVSVLHFISRNDMDISVAFYD